MRNSPKIVSVLAFSFLMSMSPAQATLTIFGPFPSITTTYGVGSIPLVPPTTNSPAPWTFSSSNPQVAIISGKRIKVMGVGISTITAMQTATGKFTSRSRSTHINVSAGTPVIALFASQSMSISQRSYMLVPPKSTSDGIWSFLSSNPNVASIVGNTVTFHSGGTTLISATQASTSNWKSATAQMTLTVLLIAPTLGTFGDVTIRMDSVASISLNPPKSNSPGAWIFTSSTPIASVVGNTVTPLTFGTTVITATQAAVGDYAAATASMTLTVQGPTPSVTPTPTPSVKPTPSAKPTPTPIPSVKPTPSPAPTPINATVRASAAGRVVTVVVIGVNALAFINGQPAKIGANTVAPGVASVVITIDDKVVYRQVFIIK